MKQIRRLELAYDDKGALAGAQATFADGTTSGLDCGAEPFYGDKLAEVAGQGLAQAQAANEAHKREIARLGEELERKERLRQAAEAEGQRIAGDVAELKGERENARARLDVANERIAALQGELIDCRDRLARKSDELQSLTVKMLAGQGASA